MLCMNCLDTYTGGYNCDICGSTHSRPEDVKQHISDRTDEDHSVSQFDLYISDITYELTEKSLESIYIVNKYAKKMSEKSQRLYQRNQKGQAKVKSEKKHSLYGVKESFLRQTIPCSSSIELHLIDGQEFICVYYKNDEWSFHNPDPHSFPVSLDNLEPKELDDFSSSSKIDSSRITSVSELENALQFLYESHSIDANKHIPYSYTNTYTYQTHSFDGWNCL